MNSLCHIKNSRHYSFMETDAIIYIYKSFLPFFLQMLK